MRKNVSNEKRGREQEEPKKPKIILVSVRGDFGPQGQEVTISYQGGRVETRTMSSDAIEKEYGKYLDSQCSAKDVEKQMQRQHFFYSATKKSKPETSNTGPKLGSSSE